MLEFHNVNVSGLEASLISCRYAMLTELPDLTNKDVCNELVSKGLERAKRLCKNPSGSGHTSLRKGIRVEFTMKYTQYITKQLQRYNHFDYITSSSMMHRITKMDFSKCCTSYVVTGNRDFMNDLKDEYNKCASCEFTTFGEWLADNDASWALRDEICGTIDTYWTEEEKQIRFAKPVQYVLKMFLISNCPMGAELFVHVNTNYEQLAIMYRQRKDHFLQEDYSAFCKMVESLPYAKELIIGEDVENG